MFYPKKGSIDLKKIQAITEWQSLRTTKGQYFLGSANFYRKFINDFSTLAKPFMDLFKKEWSFEWKDKQQMVVDILKGNLTFSPLIRFPKFPNQLKYTLMEMGL